MGTVFVIIAIKCHWELWIPCFICYLVGVVCIQFIIGHAFVFYIHWTSTQFGVSDSDWDRSRLLLGDFRILATIVGANDKENASVQETCVSFARCCFEDGIQTIFQILFLL